MLWYAVGAAVVVFGVVGLARRSVKDGLRIGLYTLLIGLAVIAVLIFGGFMGG